MKPILLLLALVALAACVPEHPRWPNKFTSEFDEEFAYGLLKGKTHGTIFYDANSGRYRINRDNGHLDRYCGLNGLHIFSGTPCDHIVDEHGDRYLYYPDKNECCFCCGAAQGCGILKPNWQAGAEFKGEIEYNGHPAYFWDKKGLQSNYYIETIDEDPLRRTMLNIDQKPNDNQIYDADIWGLVG